jgi:hypothetical protein
MDAYIDSRNRQLRSDSIGYVSIGFLFIFLGLHDVIATGGFWTGKWFNVAFGCFMLLLGVWDYMVYQRSLSTDVRIAKMRATDSPNALPVHDDAQIVAPTTSVAESTTAHLDARPRGQEKS